MIQIIVQRMTKGDITPLQAVREVRTLLGKIESVQCKRGLKLTVSDSRNRHSIPQRGLDKEEQELCEEFAVLAYAEAQESGSRKPGELHLSQGLSTKHYAGGIRSYAQKLKAQYS